MGAEDRTEALRDNLTSRIFTGLKWSYASTIVNAVLQLGLSAVMARLLTPAAFGLVAMAGVVLQFGRYFAQMGIGSAIVQKGTLSEKEVHAAFVLSTGLGALFMSIGWIAAPAAALIFGQADIVPVVRAMSISFLITGLSMSALNLLRREMNFKAIAFIEVSSYLVGYGAVGLPLAYMDFGAWSLVAAALSHSAVSAVLSYLSVRHGLSFRLTGDHFRPLVSFGSRVSIVGFLEFIGTQVDALSIGRFLGPGALGLYSRGSMLAYLPAAQLSASLSRVLFPSFSRIQNDRSRLRVFYGTAIRSTAVALFPLAAAVSVASREIVMVLLGSRWMEAVPVLRIVALAVAFGFLTQISGVLCEATANLNVKIVIQVSFILALVGLFRLLHGYGLWGYAAGVLVAQAARHLAYVIVLKRLLDLHPAQIARSYGPGLVFAVLVGGSVHIAATVMRQMEAPVIMIFAAEIAIGAALFCALVFWGPFPRVRTETRRLLSRIALGKKRRRAGLDAMGGSAE